MPKRDNYYDPMVDDGTQQLQIRAFQVQIGGTYVLMDDIVTALRAFGDSLPEPSATELIYAAVDWMTSGQPLPQIDFEKDIGSEQLDFEMQQQVFGSESDDNIPDVERIEIFPDPPDDPGAKWYARSIDTGGYVLKQTNGSFDLDWVIKNAQERWPGIPIHMLKSAGEDSKWNEDGTRGVFPSKGPPLRRLWH